MAKVKPLPSHALRASIDPGKIPYADSRDIPLGKHFEPPQPRALQALELALNIPGNEYNVYVSGEPNLGRSYFVRSFLEPRAAKEPTPPDWAYVFNFEDPDRPRAVSFPPGQGRRFKADLATAVARLREEIPIRFEQESNIKKREGLVRGFQDRRDTLYREMESAATTQGFNLNVDDEGGFTLYPLIEGKIVSGAEFDRLDPDLRMRLKNQGDELLSSITGMLRKLSVEERSLRDDEKTLDRAIVSEVLGEFLAPLAAGYRDNPGVDAFLKAMERDILDNIEHFIPREPQPQQPAPPPADGGAPSAAEDHFARYEVNLVVDNSGLTGAPIIFSDHPTYFNLLGCIEREAELGALLTDFTLIKAGAVHKANGGFLVMHVEDILVSSFSWEGLLRVLHSGMASIEDPVDGDTQVRTKTIEPEPIPLNLKIVLIGTDETYEALLYNDDRFRKYFKLKAHLQEFVDRSSNSIKVYLRAIARIIEEAKLRPFDREALAYLMEHASRLASNQTRLSLKLPQVRELMIEASALAGMRKKPMVDRAILKAAQDAADFRSNLFEQEFMTDYDREIIKVVTDGTTIGRVNGLAVTYFGDYEFGLPHQIACNVGVGHGGIIDLEREAQLAGPIHTKAMMILKSWLLGLFAHNKPLVLAGSLCFEQSYAGIEGDSASGAELAALLSALAEVPINRSYAFTGAVSQAGAIMAVGGVDRKIEGYFEVCRRRGLTGRQGVLIPVDNVKDLMLKQNVLEAVDKGLFSIYPVHSIEEAMEILTGMPAGHRRKDGTFPPGTLYRLVDQRLARFTELACRSSEPPRPQGI